MVRLPSRRVMYQALVQRDPSYDGLFFAGVRTTGIFCRPTCTARKPLEPNVEFFRSPADAERAGYRACRRCRPLETSGTHPAWVARVLNLLHARRDKRITDFELKRVGIDPVRARRYFIGRFGMTLHGYQRSVRLGFALERMNDGDGPSRAAYQAGFESESGFREAFKRLFGQTPSDVRGVRPIVATVLASPVGPLVAAATEDGLCLLEFGDRKRLPAQAASLTKWFERPVVPGTHRHIDRAEKELDEYFAGKRTRFEVPLVIRGTPFQEGVWRELLRIPYGVTRSYEEIARTISRPGAQRAVGMANGMNRIAIIVPCHRVIEKRGGLRGYGGGLWRKQFLLDLERRVAQPNALADTPLGSAVGAVPA